jgi:hypothetical protein
LERIDKAIRIEEPVTLLSNNASEAISRSMGSESLCPDTEYSINETGNRRRNMEIVFAFSLPLRRTLYKIRMINMSNNEKRVLRNLKSPSITNGTVMYNDKGG